LRLITARRNTRLLATFTLSEYERAGLLLNQPALGADMPSVVMDRMLAHLGTHPPCFLFRRLFLDLMPDDVRTVLVHSAIADSRELAQLADRLWLAKQPSTSAVRISSTASSADKPKTNTGNPDFCWYHRKWGQGATKCKQPCTFPSKSGNASAGRQ
jgi:hypothetical protein